MKDACVIIPVHNRRTTTLECLRVLAATKVFNWATVVVVDDGSADGTALSIAEEYPEAIVLIGNGDLWWAGAINLGMEFALKEGYERFFWLNDDCHPEKNAMWAMSEHVRNSAAICSAVSTTPSNYQYAGFVKTVWGLKSVSEGPCDTMSGNCVCLPRELVETVGLLDAKHFPMDPADADYGLRARRAGYGCFVLKEASCHSADNISDGKQSWLFSDVPLRVFVKNFVTNKQHCSYIGTRFRFHMRHWGFLGGIIALGFYTRFLLFSILRILIPRYFRLKLASRSSSWRKADCNARKVG